MLSVFPTLLFFGAAFVPLALRITVALCVGSLAYRHLAHRAQFAEDIAPYARGFGKELALLGAIIEALVAILLFVGFYTQIAALLAIALFAKIIFFKKSMPFFGTQSRGYYLLLLVLSIMVLFAGPGPLGFDYPL